MSLVANDDEFFDYFRVGESSALEFEVIGKSHFCCECTFALDRSGLNLLPGVPALGYWN